MGIAELRGVMPPEDGLERGASRPRLWVSRANHPAPDTVAAHGGPSEARRPSVYAQCTELGLSRKFFFRLKTARTPYSEVHGC